MKGTDSYYKSHPCHIVLRCENELDDDTMTALSRMLDIMFSLEPAKESPDVDLCFEFPQLGLDESL